MRGLIIHSLVTCRVVQFIFQSVDGIVNLVPRVSPLHAPGSEREGREEERPWERGCGIVWTELSTENSIIQNTFLVLFVSQQQQQQQFICIPIYIDGIAQKRK